MSTHPLLIAQEDRQGRYGGCQWVYVLPLYGPPPPVYPHKTLASFGYWLIGLHTAAALFHHYIVKDNALVRMLPLMKKR